MERDLLAELPAAQLPAGFCWWAWQPLLLETHARIKYLSFSGQRDTLLFPCLGTEVECRELMAEIVGRPGFLPAATWVLATGDQPIGVIQGVIEGYRMGGIQNVGVAPNYRRRGFGRQLLLKAMHGFRDAGLRWAVLEVTAENLPAVRMYRQLGFRRTKTLFRAVP